MDNLGQKNLLTARLQQLFQQAYGLAYFICPEKEIALQIAIEAIKVWGVTCASQGKRRYYNLKGRRLGNNERKMNRTKVHMQDDQLLQRLIYKFSQQHELSLEKRNTITMEGLIVHYLKHLIALTIRNNSFYVVVGISRILHRYSNRETVDLYMALAANRTTQDIADIDRECKRYKGKLMNELKERFAGLINIRRVEQDEERFEIIDNPSPFHALVDECLCWFLPWNTACFTAGNDFLFNGDNPDDEHKVEMKRIHALIHPDCYSRLTYQLNFAHPHKRLEIPQFLFSKDSNNGGDGNRRQAPEINDEMRGLLEQLNELSNRRKNASIGVLSIMLDGKEKALWDLHKQSGIHLEFTEGAELIEIYQQDENLLLASCLLDEYPDLIQLNSIQLEAGQEITFKIARRIDSETTTFIIDISYRETELKRVVSLFWQRLNQNLFWGRLNLALASKFAIVSTIIITCLLATVLYFQSVKWNKPDLIAINQNDPNNLWTTRSGATSENLKLSDIKKIYLESSNNNTQSLQLRQYLITGLSANGKLVVVTDKDDADGLLRISSTNDKTSIQLINRAGTIVWVSNISITNREVRDIGNNIIEKLFKDMEKR